MKKYRVGYTSGVYDMFHVGHLNILRQAKKYCDKLIVGVTSDELCFQRKNKHPIICLNDRIEILNAIKYVDQVIVQNTMEKIQVIKEYEVDVVFVGTDWKGTESWIKYEKEFALYNCAVEYIDYTEKISSTILREKLNNG